MICLAALAACLAACGGPQKPSFSDGAIGGIEHELVVEGGAQAPVRQGASAGHLSIDSKVGSHVAGAVVCEGVGFLQITLDGKPIGQATCQSTYQRTFDIGFQFTAYTDPSVIGLEPVKGQRWWAAVSGPGGATL